VPQEETLKALDRLVRDGKVRYVGCSTHPPWRTVEALHIADRLGLPKFVCEQPPYNLVDRQVENEIVPMCQAYDMGILAWSPLAQGTLAGRYKKASGYAAGSRPTKKDVFAERVTDAGIAVAQRTAEIAAQRGVPLPAFAVAWVLHQPAVTSVILGPRTVEHLEGVLGAGEIELSPDELSACDHLVPPGNFVADHFNTARWRPEAQRG
jgi:aryl-alcohol dehydrogenase-like predicted oxidoreductase